MTEQLHTITSQRNLDFGCLAHQQARPSAKTVSSCSRSRLAPLRRAGETSDHEFDFRETRTWRYRDYVVRTFNDDLPYDRFVREQIVLGKTFLGLIVACARCHDHKFDPGPDDFCAFCHSRIDPLGFALENFDVFGPC